MQDLSPQNITLLLEDCIKGKKGAVDEMLPHVYNELRKYHQSIYEMNTEIILFKQQNLCTKPT